jgi:hypothetical protein
MGNEQSVRHEPPTAGSGGSSSSFSRKSTMTRTAAMTRTASVNVMAAGLGASEVRYLPRGLDRAHNGIRMPTRPNGHGNGDISPQMGYGWYTLNNATPPTPEMYHSRSSSTSSHSSRSEPSMDPSHFPNSTAPNSVFQGLKASANRPQMGWPSVPL